MIDVTGQESTFQDDGATRQGPAGQNIDRNRRSATRKTFKGGVFSARKGIMSTQFWVYVACRCHACDKLNFEPVDREAGEAGFIRHHMGVPDRGRGCSQW